MSKVEIQVACESNCTINNQQKQQVKSKSLTNKSGPLVEKIRSNILDLHAKDPSQFDPEDIERVKSDDWFVKKFLIAQDRNVKSASAMLTSTLKWRKSQGVNKSNLRAIPAELFRLGAFFAYEHDKEGHEVIYVRANFFRRNKTLRPILIQYGVTIGCQVERRATNGVVCVIDFKNFSISETDLEIMRIIISTIVNHFPVFVQRFFVLNIPSVLQLISNFVVNLIPSSGRNRVTFADSQELTKYIDQDKIPDFLGGTCKRRYKGNDVVPNGAPNFLEYAKQVGWSNEQYRTIYKTFKSIFENEGLEPLPEPSD